MTWLHLKCLYISKKTLEIYSLLISYLVVCHGFKTIGFYWGFIYTYIIRRKVGYGSSISWVSVILIVLACKINS